MSGIVSVIFWATAGLGAALAFPIPARVGFIFCGAASTYYAAYRVCKDADTVAKEAKGELEITRIELHRARPFQSLAKHITQPGRTPEF
jgi:hypothetical protein